MVVVAGRLTADMIVLDLNGTADYIARYTNGLAIDGLAECDLIINFFSFILF